MDEATKATTETVTNSREPKTSAELKTDLKEIQGRLLERYHEAIGNNRMVEATELQKDLANIWPSITPVCQQPISKKTHYNNWLTYNSTGKLQRRRSVFCALLVGLGLPFAMLAVIGGIPGFTSSGLNPECASLAILIWGAALILRFDYSFGHDGWFSWKNRHPIDERNIWHVSDYQSN